MSSVYDGAGSEPADFEALVESFYGSERPDGSSLIGAESEKIGVRRSTLEPLGYGQEFGVCKVMASLHERFGWSAIREQEGGPVLGLTRDNASVTLEPGAQFELSGAPQPDVHAVAREQANHLGEIRPISESLDIVWLATGFHPSARLEELPWVPKLRYPIMRRYLPTRGVRAHDMMQRTATVQANFDRSSERDGMLKVALGLRLSPLVHAMFANSPFKEGAPSGRLSERGDVWLHMDPSRSGLIEPLWRKPLDELSYRDYAEWALDSGMFLLWRDGKVVENTGQTFRDFLQNGFEGHRATVADFKLHLTTLFPEVRLKNTIEVRSADSQSPELALAMVALWTGLLLDDQARSEALSFVESFRYEEIMAARPELVTCGLRAKARPFGGLENFAAARKICELARAGLTRRARTRADGRDETVYLEPLEALLERGEHPADRALALFEKSEGTPAERFVRALEIPLPSLSA